MQTSTVEINKNSLSPLLCFIESNSRNLNYRNLVLKSKKPKFLILRETFKEKL